MVAFLPTFTVRISNAAPMGKSRIPFHLRPSTATHAAPSTHSSATTTHHAPAGIEGKAAQDHLLACQ